ncbi:hypothetical protein [Salarchaeum sp. JOR-1]|uniref:hypothetical protein n=1 Tax=Salarchaeum sp. JOR-1 TaxID=2599399 RepID=UPI00119846E1|nr:hypothetical protein [Salarchaeum sp. JOR-1]QDX41772.1 hypothetical protein FQU85_12975 [Salarchaeum sp. JOR-1]
MTDSHTPPTATTATRTLLTTVDTPRAELDAVLDHAWDTTTPQTLGTHIENLVDDALHDRAVEQAESLPIDEPATFLLGSALAGVRIEHATPFKAGPDAYQRRTTTRAVEQPLAANPGSSALFQRLRSVYQRALLATFDARDDIKRVVARVLLSPTTTTAPVCEDPADTMIATVRLDAEDGTEYVVVPAEACTQWCRTIPFHRDCDPPPLVRQPDANTVRVPVALLRAKFAAAARFGFERAVHRAFHRFRDWRYAAVKRESWQVETLINDTYVRNALPRLYGDRRYDTASTTTAPGPERTGFTPVTHHPQLAAIVDVIRATPSLSFTDYHTARDLYTHAQEYYPPPHRPPNTLWSVQRIAGVLHSAADATGGTNDVVEQRTHPGANGPPNEYRIAAPRPTPLYTRPADATGDHRWTAYRAVRTRHASEPLPADTRIAPGTRQAAATTDDPLAAATTATHRYAATHPHARPLDAIGPAEHPDAFDADYDVQFSADTLTFLTRVVAGLNGLVADDDLRDGMRHYQETTDGELDVDPGRLAAADVIDTHTAGYVTMYSVASDVVAALNRTAVTQEGYGDATPSEKGKHKYGAVLLAAGIAARDDVATVIRYPHLWRFDLGVDEQALQTRLENAGRDVTVTDLDQRRLDVAGLNSAGDLVCAGEVQLNHGKASRVRRNWEKLRYVGEAGVDTVWLMPDLESLSTIIADLQAEQCLASGPLPNTDRVAHWQSYFDTHDLYNPGIQNFSTYRSLYRGEIKI